MACFKWPICLVQDDPTADLRVTVEIDAEFPLGGRRNHTARRYGKRSTFGVQGEGLGVIGQNVEHARATRQHEAQELLKD